MGQALSGVFAVRMQKGKDKEGGRDKSQRQAVIVWLSVYGQLTSQCWRQADSEENDRRRGTVSRAHGAKPCRVTLAE
jgi:hypothetical protein